MLSSTLFGCKTGFAIPLTVTNSALFPRPALGTSCLPCTGHLSSARLSGLGAQTLSSSPAFRSVGHSRSASPHRGGHYTLMRGPQRGMQALGRPCCPSWGREPVHGPLTARRAPGPGVRGPSTEPTQPWSPPHSPARSGSQGGSPIQPFPASAPPQGGPNSRTPVRQRGLQTLRGTRAQCCESTISSQSKSAKSKRADDLLRCADANKKSKITKKSGNYDTTNGNQ